MKEKKAQVHLGRDLIIIAVIFVVLCLNLKNSTKESLFITLLLSWITTICFDGVVGEYKLNKKVYPYTVMLGCEMLALTVCSALNYYGVIGNGEISPIVFIVAIFVVLGVSTVIYYSVRHALNKKERTVVISAVCCNNIVNIVPRYLNNTGHAKVERAHSAAYASEYTTLYTPVFSYTYNGMTYETKSNVSKNMPLEIGSVYQIKINPKNPTEISASL